MRMFVGRRLEELPQGNQSIRAPIQYSEVAQIRKKIKVVVLLVLEVVASSVRAERKHHLRRPFPPA